MALVLANADGHRRVLHVLSGTCNTSIDAMSATPHLPLTLPEPGITPIDRGHVRERARTGTKRSMTTVELTMDERLLLDQLAKEDGSSRAAVMRDALRAFAQQRGRSIDDVQETPHAA
jgi:hypothetical protein